MGQKPAYRPAHRHDLRLVPLLMEKAQVRGHKQRNYRQVTGLPVEGIPSGVHRTKIGP